ncbi:MAG: hypothetical protein HY815_11635 [Candidatus Riflebacteria bacterium]|nr:hypothetical protein [Candidatus Riflebacteria bacterium]
MTATILCSTPLCAADSLRSGRARSTPVDPLDELLQQAARRQQASISPDEVADQATLVARRLHEVLWRNGTLARMESIYASDPTQGSGAFGYQWMMAEFLRLQRDEFRALMTRADRLLVMPSGFARQQVALGLVERLVKFRKSSRRFRDLTRAPGDGAADAGSNRDPAGSNRPSVQDELRKMSARMDRCLAEMDRRTIDIQRLLEATI